MQSARGVRKLPRRSILISDLSTELRRYFVKSVMISYKILRNFFKLLWNIIRSLQKISGQRFKEILCKESYGDQESHGSFIALLCQSCVSAQRGRHRRTWQWSEDTGYSSTHEEPIKKISTMTFDVNKAPTLNNNTIIRVGDALTVRILWLPFTDFRDDS